MNTARILNLLLKDTVNNNQINKIIKNIENNQLNENEIIYLAKYGVYYRQYQLVELAYAYNIDIHIDNDYIFRKAIKKEDSDTLSLLLKHDYDYYETYFFNKKNIVKTIINNILEDNKEEIHSDVVEISLTDDNKKIIKNILMYMFNNNIEITQETLVNVLIGYMDDELIDNIRRVNDFCDIFFYENDFHDILSHINNKLLITMFEYCTPKQTDILVKHYLSRYTIKLLDIKFNPEYMLNMNLLKELIKSSPYRTDIKIEKLSKIPINTTELLNYFDETQDEKISMYIIMIMIKSEMFTEKELCEKYGEEKIKKHTNMFAANYLPQHYESG